MTISGLQKMTLLDYPGHIACTVFLGGCNFSCPYCYNSSLICYKSNPIISQEEFFAFLEKRKGKLDGVAITGGEPLLNNDIKDFIKRIKGMGFLVKIDTNGSYPEVLEDLINQNLVDYVAMDIKNSIHKYNLTTNSNVDISKIKRSVDILLANKIDYEFRTTVVKELHEIEDFRLIGEWIKGAKHYFIQSFKNSDSVLNKNLHSMSKTELLECLKEVQQFISNASLRGID
jgi:pyruvate formate lyase activating enzyme